MSGPQCFLRLPFSLPRGTTSRFIAKVKVAQLQNLKKEEFQEKLEAQRKELNALRIEKVRGGAASKLMQIKVVRRNIARILTIMSQKRRDAVKREYASKKLKPLDLRVKGTRAHRRRLPASAAARKTTRQRKRELHFPQRKFYVKA